MVGSDGKEKHVAVNIADADKIVKQGVSDGAGTMLATLENIAGDQDDAGKVFITPESEKAEDEPTYLLRNKPGLQGKADTAQRKADTAQGKADDATGRAKGPAQVKADAAQERADTAQGKADTANE